MKTAVIYARYSSDNQTEQSIEGQLHVCKDFAERNEIFIIDTYIDRAMTGTNDNRPEFRRMLEDSHKQKWDYVLVYKLDRFSRNKYEATIHKKTLKDNGVKVISAMENIPDSPEGILMESLLEGFNQYYSEELAQKVKRGMRETRMKGFFQGGGLPYGYKVENRKIIINEQEAEIVRYIFKEYASGLFARQIIENLTAKGILKNGKPFVYSRVYAMLKNPCYVGKYTKDGESFDNMYPRIIDDETFHKASLRCKALKNGKKSVKTVYLLKNKLVCGYCGKAINAECGTSRLGQKTNYYKCSGRKKYRNGCKKETVRQEVLENYILEEVTKEITNPKNLECITSFLLNLQESPKQNSVLNMLEKFKKQAENNLKNLLKALECGIMNKTTNQRMTELEKEIEDLEKQILIENSKTKIFLNKDMIKRYFIEALKKKPQEFIELLIKQIKMFDDKLIITFNSPIKKEPQNDEVSFLFSRDVYFPKPVQHHAFPDLMPIKIDYYI